MKKKLDVISIFIIRHKLNVYRTNKQLHIKVEFKINFFFFEKHILLL